MPTSLLPRGHHVTIRTTIFATDPKILGTGPQTNEPLHLRSKTPGTPYSTMAQCPKIIMSIFWIAILVFVVWPIAIGVSWLWIILMVSRGLRHSGFGGRAEVLFRYSKNSQTVHFILSAHKAIRVLFQLCSVHKFFLGEAGDLAENDGSRHYEW